MSLDICINLNTIAQAGLTPTEYCYLVTVFKKIQYIGTINQSQLQAMLKSLENRGFIKIMGDESIVLRNSFLNLMQKDSSPLLVDQWIDDWRALFPKNVRTSGRPVRGDKKSCLKKMITFCKEYSEYSKDQIFEATRIYVFEKSRENYSYMTSADYFIYKETRKGERTSILASILEDIEGRQTDLQIIENGDSPFSKNI